MQRIWTPGQPVQFADAELSRAVAQTNAISVRATVESRADRAEALQAIVSQWSPSAQWGSFDAYDAAGTDGLNSIGYFGAVFDGRYVYFSPEQKNAEETHGVVLRYDTHGDFKNRASWSAYDASQTDGLPTRGYYGAAFDGRYVYFVPRQLDMKEYHTHVLRYDTHGDFKDKASWNAFDAGDKHSSQGCAFDGRYLYFCPGFSGNSDTEETRSGRVLRLDTQGDFKSKSSYQMVDINDFLGSGAMCFDGGAFDGRFVYFVPIETTTVVQYDTHGDFKQASSWKAFDAKNVGLGVNVGLVFDGRYMYCCAYAHGTIVRFDTTRDFVDPKSWQSYRADFTNGLKTIGFDGGFFDGRFVYFIPFVSPNQGGGYTFHANYLRYDTQGDFADPKSWDAHDASATDGMKSVGYNAGAFDGRYFYAAPWQQGPRPDGGGPMIHARVLRYDTLGNRGSFSLRYCDYGHNGGLCAAVPGPSFLVNTDRGVLSASAHRALRPGRHELRGVYDGRSILLYVDGQIVCRRDGHGGRIIPTDEPISIGQIHGGLGAFDGEIQSVQISSIP